MSAIEEIAAERRRQIEVEGWTPEHDDHHSEEEGEALAAAASFYAAPDWFRRFMDANDIGLWPFGREHLKTGNRRRELVKAGALIVAEIERLDRLDRSSPPTEAPS